MGTNIKIDCMISVVIPMYNAERTIIRCLNSVVSQTYTNDLEIIIINDGSTDNSKNLVEEFINNYSQFSIRLINKENSGVSETRNLGIKEAKGFYIALLDSDDEWLPNKLEIQYKYLSNYDIDFLGCGRNNENISIFFRKISGLYKISCHDLLIKMFPQTSTAIFKKELFEKFGGYNTQMTHAEDGELWIRYCMNCNFYYLSENLVITDGGKPSFGFSGLSANLNKMTEGYFKILKLALDNKIINKFQYILFYLFYELKHYRRVLLTKFR